MLNDRLRTEFRVDVPAPRINCICAGWGAASGAESGVHAAAALWRRYVNHEKCQSHSNDSLLDGCFGCCRHRSTDDQDSLCKGSVRCVVGHRKRVHVGRVLQGKIAQWLSAECLVQYGLRGSLLRNSITYLYCSSAQKNRASNEKVVGYPAAKTAS